MLAPRRSLSLDGLRAMTAVSGIVCLLGGVLTLVLAVALLRDPAVGRARSGLVWAAIVGGVLFTKALVELSAAIRLRGVENAPLSALPLGAGFQRVATAWLMAFWVLFVVLVLHVVLGVVWVVVAVGGLALAVVVTVATFGIHAKDAFSTWRSAVDIVSQPFRWLGDGLVWLVHDQTTAMLTLAVIGLLLVGPLACAAVLHARMGALRAAAGARRGAT
jgi:hypothetical protein